MRDLEIRGAGNLLGMEQTGFVNDVGFDLFVKLINEAVEELKYEEFKEVFKDACRNLKKKLNQQLTLILKLVFRKPTCRNKWTD
ncbi:MAG: hypothetical protein MZV64_61050 [Ignavibacteriales bacterium]|nr:hypothetical protein [Ignavibacteriales bacterium]